MMTRDSFKEYIRNEIIEMLSEAPPDNFENIKNLTKDTEKFNNELERTKGLLSNLPLGEESDSYNYVIPIPQGTDYKEFAKGVARVLIKGYGAHNYKPFMDELSKKLGIDNN